MVWVQDGGVASSETMLQDSGVVQDGGVASSRGVASSESMLQGVASSESMHGAYVKPLPTGQHAISKAMKANKDSLSNSCS